MFCFGEFFWKKYRYTYYQDVFAKFVKLQVLFFFASFFSSEGIVDIILRIIVKLIGQGPIYMVFI